HAAAEIGPADPLAARRREQDPDRLPDLRLARRLGDEVRRGVDRDAAALEVEGPSGPEKPVARGHHCTFSFVSLSATLLPLIAMSASLCKVIFPFAVTVTSPSEVIASEPFAASNVIVLFCLPSAIVIFSLPSVSSSVTV